MPWDLRSIRNRPPTARQLECLKIVAEWVLARGFPPAVREIGDRMGIRSTNGVIDHMLLLEKRGLLERADMDSRSIRITEAGWTLLGVKPGCCPHCGATKPTTTPELG